MLAPKGFNKNEYNVVFNMRSNLTILLLGLVAVAPVSYTHLTLPTICSV